MQLVFNFFTYVMLVFFPIQVSAQVSEIKVSRYSFTNKDFYGLLRECFENEEYGAYAVLYYYDDSEDSICFCISVLSKSPYYIIPKCSYGYIKYKGRYCFLYSDKLYIKKNGSRKKKIKISNGVAYLIDPFQYHYVYYKKTGAIYQKIFKYRPKY